TRPSATAAGRRLIATGQSDGPKALIRLWDARTGERVHTLEGHIGLVTGLAFSPDGERLLSAASDFTVKLWHTGTGKELLTFREHRDSPLGVAWSADGRRLATVGQDGALKVHQLAGAEVPDTSRWQRLFHDDFERSTPGDRWEPIDKTRWSVEGGRLRGEVVRA